MVLARSLLVLAVLCAPLSSLCLRPPQTDPGLLCPDELLPTANNEEPPLNSLYDTLQLLHRAGDSLSLEESRERRTSPGSGYRFLSQSMLRRSKMYRNGAKGDRGSRMTLSLDVPTSLMNILFDIAKGKSLRAQAAHNARLMAQIG
ncbi:urocortin 3, like [Colossoma macropomum]|uniref:urocortin 3, like n=1 Tax=Colossoma macropomum TaxID=42526 RepID=UPI0018650E41|nr:urocortin 3, like [Colossoma macropomum]XP_036433577.1 urocortin 3, like [Colossoma macropomum]